MASDPAPAHRGPETPQAALENRKAAAGLAARTVVRLVALTFLSPLVLLAILVAVGPWGVATLGVLAGLVTLVYLVLRWFARRYHPEV